MAEISNSAMLSFPTEANDAHVSVPPTTISKKASFVTARRIKSARSMWPRFVREFNVVFGRIESIGRLVVTAIGVIPFQADRGNPRISHPPSD